MQKIAILLDEESRLCDDGMSAPVAAHEDVQKDMYITSVCDVSRKRPVGIIAAAPSRSCVAPPVNPV